MLLVPAIGTMISNLMKSGGAINQAVRAGAITTVIIILLILLMKALLSKKQYFWFDVQFCVINCLAIIYQTFDLLPYFREEIERDAEIQEYRFIMGFRLFMGILVPTVFVRNWWMKLTVFTGTVFCVYYISSSDGRNAGQTQSFIYLFIMSIFYAAVWRVTDNQQERYLDKLEVKLQEERSWKALIEELSNGIVTIDYDHQITYANPATYQMFGLDEEDTDYKDLGHKISKSKVRILNA